MGDLGFEQPVNTLGIHDDYLKVDFYKGDLYYSDGKKEIRIKPAKVKQGNYINWFETQVVAPRVEIPKRADDMDTHYYYSVAMVHCCSKDTIDCQGCCFSDTLSDGLRKRCWGGAEIMHPENSSMIAMSVCKPPYNQFIHWLVVNIPEKKTDLKTSKSASNGETVICYSPLTENMPKKGSGTHRYAFFLFKQSQRIKNDKQLVSKAATPVKNSKNDRYMYHNFLKAI